MSRGLSRSKYGTVWLKSAFCQARLVNIDYVKYVGTFLERADGSFKPLKPHREVKLVITDAGGRIQGEAAFTVREDELFHSFGVVRRTGPEFAIELEKDGIVPWERGNGDAKRPYNNVCSVWRQGVRIEHRPTGRKKEIIYSRDR